MNRRGFLGALSLTAAGLAVPELWTPRRTFILPPRGGWTGRPASIEIVNESLIPAPTAAWGEIQAVIFGGTVIDAHAGVSFEFFDPIIVAGQPG